MKIEVHFLDDSEKIYKKVFINDIHEQMIYIGDTIHDLEIEDEEEEVKFLEIN